MQNAFQVLQRKSLGVDIKCMDLCPTMDLVAVSYFKWIFLCTAGILFPIE